MAHGSPSMHKCDICKTVGRMPRFGSYKCSKGHETTSISQEELTTTDYKWIGWYN